MRRFLTFSVKGIAIAAVMTILVGFIEVKDALPYQMEMQITAVDQSPKHLESTLQRRK